MAYTAVSSLPELLARIRDEARELAESCSNPSKAAVDWDTFRSILYSWIELTCWLEQSLHQVSLPSEDKAIIVSAIRIVSDTWRSSRLTMGLPRLPEFEKYLDALGKEDHHGYTPV